MKAWKLVDETECGYWVYVGKVEELHGCVVDWVAHNKDGKPLPLSVSGQYVTIQVPKSGCFTGSFTRISLTVSCLQGWKSTMWMETQSTMWLGTSKLCHRPSTEDFTGRRGKKRLLSWICGSVGCLTDLKAVHCHNHPPPIGPLYVWCICKHQKRVQPRKRMKLRVSTKQRQVIRRPSRLL